MISRTSAAITITLMRVILNFLSGLSAPPVAFFIRAFFSDLLTLSQAAGQQPQKESYQQSYVYFLNEKSNGQANNNSQCKPYIPSLRRFLHLKRFLLVQRNDVRQQSVSAGNTCR